MFTRALSRLSVGFYPQLLRILATCGTTVSRAGRIVRAVSENGKLGIVDKGWNDLQTEADRAAQRCIVASLSKSFPNVTIIGEEETDPNEDIKPDWVETSLDENILKHVSNFPEEWKDVKDEDIVIWVDPLDGTAEYTQGLLDHVTVLIGIAVKGKAVAGVIHQPYYNYKAGPGATLGRTIWGMVGLGAFGYTQKQPPKGKNIITTTRSHSNKVVTDSVDACEPTEVIRVGGAGHKVLLLIEGEVHAYVFASPGCKKWDTCAPEAILTAIGGKLTDIHGSKLQYHKEVQHKNTAGVLATFSVDHQWYLDKIPQSAKDALKP
ncbi:3'(2'),5'-bisphosphate nucleotidase 1 isoform X2 [Lingula anatina]|uniref:3'(2'),5'-bisphosphate nucleotidase 1 n=1 Tax=Lingula anatina TaxID=7574 RepID=A0A1S3K4T1_LINAN|nr:3'(2'),5'-bisphosphate nucleotidase 1 isoform X2 [Lingula anatina]|eukprot:XP_013417261.1 3'(2'),5'-bisphosphate nucleotidase 1 isoform X2 [Lingula anatina]